MKEHFAKKYDFSTYTKDFLRRLECNYTKVYFCLKPYQKFLVGEKLQQATL